MSRYTGSERLAILRSARDACVTAEELQAILVELRSRADVLRSEASRLRLESAGLRHRPRPAPIWGGAPDSPPG